MCTSVTTIWNCKRCLGKVLLDKSSGHMPCHEAQMRRAFCPPESTNYLPPLWKCAGSDVDPRESLTDPSKGRALLKWCEWYCFACEMDVFELPKLKLHADSEELDLGVSQEKEDREVVGTRSDDWETLPLMLWRKGEKKTRDEELQLGIKKMWYSMIPVDKEQGNVSLASDDDVDDEDMEDGGAPLW
ncbi:hypothetical protein SUNI508_00478 [Seiridium unicorne]|uniref:Uncharacterized protein n=1 Tax=Seiridium unicorne TaxID=138068 RepID=A0ABR2V6T1_9PEZI